MTQIFTGTGLGVHGSSLGQLGGYGPKGTAGLGQGGESVYVNAANGNVVLKQSDGFLADFGVGLDVFQSYNSRGAGAWRFNTETSLQFEGAPNTPGSIVKRTDEDGHVSCFKYASQHQTYCADDGSTARLTFDGASWDYREGTGSTTCHYNTDGQLTSLSDRDGVELRFSYQNGQLATITDNRNQQTITWSFSQGQLSDVTFQSEGQTIHHVHYDYDAQHRLNRVSRDLGDGKTYWIAYDYEGDSHWISDIRQSDGTALHLDYDAEGRIKRLVDGEGHVTSYAYEAGKTTVTNDLGESWTYFYDADSRLTGIDGPENIHIRYHYDGKHLDAITQGNQRWQFVYNDAGDCVRIEDPTGEITLRDYDNEHRMLSETRYQAFDGNHHPITPQTSRFIYDEQGHLRFEIMANGRVTEHRYDDNGSRTNSRCYLKGQYLPADAALNDLIHWSQSQPQDAVSLVDYHYDFRGCLSEELHYTQVDIHGFGVETSDLLRTYSRYDAAGRLVETSFLTENGLSTTHYLYDDLGRLIQTIDNQHHTQTIDYDDAHQRVIKTDANGLKTLLTYDHSGMLLSTQRLYASHDYGTFTYRYDAAGRLIAETDVEGKTRHLFYDTQGRLQGTVSTSGHVTEYQYDDDGHCILTHQYQQTIDLQSDVQSFALIKPQQSKQDRISQVVYNEYQQIAYQIDAEGAVIAYRYDAEARVITKTAYATRLKDYEPSRSLSITDMVLRTSGDDRLLTYYYDAVGRLQAEINGEGSAMAYCYDLQGHLMEKIRYANKVILPHTGDWSVDAPSANGREDIHTYSFYNTAGLKVADVDAEGYLTEYVYDARGLLIDTIAYYTAFEYLRALTENTQLDAIRPSHHLNDHRTTYRYNDLNQRVEARTQSGLVITYLYDEQGHVIRKTSTDNQTHEARQQCYRYDALGRVIQSLDELGAARLQQSSTLNPDEIETIWKQHSVRYTYDIADRLISKTNAIDQTSRYFYDDAGLLTYSLSANGAVTETRYNAFEQVETTIRYSAFCSLDEASLTAESLRQYMTASADSRFDEVTHFEYNSLGLLLSQRQGQGSTLTTTYNAFGELEQTSRRIDSNQNTLTNYQYDRSGLLRTRVEDVGGIHQSFEVRYDVFGRIEIEWDGRRGATTYQYNNRGEQSFIENQGHGRKMIDYDAFGRVLSIEDKAHVAYAYDDQHMTLTLGRVGGASTVVTQFNVFGDKITVTDGNHQATHYEYDAKGQLIHIDAPENATTDYTYDAAGHLTFQDDVGSLKRRYTYDAEGHVLTKSVDPEGLNLITTYTYDGLGRQLQVVDAGRCTQLIYDGQGDLIRTRLDPDGLNLITEMSYNDRGLLVRETRQNPNGANKVTSYEWDALSRCVATTIDPDGLRLTTTYAYDNNDNLICQTEPNQQATHYVYNANNQVRYRIDARGVVTEHRYGINGNEKQTTTYAHRIAAVLHYDEITLSAMIQSDDKADHHQFFAFDKLSRLTQSYDGLGYATEYIYDANDNIVVKKYHAIPCSLSQLKAGERPMAVSSIQSRTTSFAYDGLNRERFRIDSQGQITESYYDASGQLIKQTRFSHMLSPDDMSQVTSLTSIEAHLRVDPEHDESIQYAYDKAGRLTFQASAAGAVTVYQYDTAGNITERRQYATVLTIAQLADENWSNHLQISDADRVIRSLYDAGGRELYRISATGHVVERRYDLAGNVVQEISHAMTYSLTTYTLAALKAALAQVPHVEHESDFVYDATGRLLQKTEGANTTRYTYDANNNVATKTDANHAVWTYHYNEANQLIETIAPAMSVKRLQQGVWMDDTSAVITHNQYDSFGNLVTVIRDVGFLNQTIHYAYDANNRKIQTLYPDVMVNTAGQNATSERQEIAQTLKETTTYNAFGEVIETRDRAGHARFWAYDNSGHMRFSIDAQGGLTEYQYNAFETVTQKIIYAERLALKSLTDYSVQTIRHARSISVYDRHEEMLYDKDHRVIETRKDRMRFYDLPAAAHYYSQPITRLTYNAFGDVVVSAEKLSDVAWAITKTTFDNDGLKIATLDAENYLTTYAYNEWGQLREEVQYAERAANLVPHANAKDRTVTFLYDPMGQLTSKTLKQVTFQRLTGNGSQFESVTRDLTSSYGYDAMGHLVSTTDAFGHTAYSYYNVTGQLIAKVGAETAAGRAATTYYYDALGQQIDSRQWARGARLANEAYFTLNGDSQDDLITHDDYDAQGHLMSQTDGTGHQIQYSYDANGNIARSWQTLKRADNTVLTQDKRYTYDDENHLIETATLKAGGARSTDNAQYNRFGEVAQKGVDGVYATHIDYDLAGRVWRSNTQGYYQIYVYDLADHITQIITTTNAFGAEYDDNGVDLTHDTYETASGFEGDAWYYDLQRQDIVYDALGHVIRQIRPGSLGSQSKTDKKDIPLACQNQQLDRWGNVTLHTNALGYTTRYDYNAMDNLTEQVLPEVNAVDAQGVARLLCPVIHYAYDALGRVIAMTDANHHTAAKILDAEGRIIQEIDALSQHRDKAYNLLNQLTQSTSERGEITAYTYDKANRLLEVKTPETAQQYAYDGAGQLLQQTDARGNVSWMSYDELGHLIERKQSGIKGATTYEYDTSGHKTLERDANGKAMIWRYDSNGRVQSHTDLGGHQIDYTYNRNGLLLTEKSTSGKSITYHYFSDGEIQQYVDNNSLEVVDFTYDAEGSVLSKRSSRVGDWALETDHYQYDALGRLLQVRRRSPEDKTQGIPEPDHALLSIDYEYDAVGNIRDTTVDANYTGYQHLSHKDYFSYDANNRMVVNKGQLQNGAISISAAQGSELEYDASGNIKSAIKYEGGQRQAYEYHYNLDNQLLRVQKNGHDLQAKRYVAGVIEEEALFDNKGLTAQHNTMRYDAGRLVGQTTQNASGDEVNKTEFVYDDAGNLIKLTTTSAAQGRTPGFTQTHEYSYELWDGYLQKNDYMSVTSPGKATMNGRSERIYDINGLLQDALDTQASGPSSTTHYFSSSIDGVRARKDKDGQTSYLTVAGKTIGDLRLDGQKVQHLEVYGGFTPVGSAQLSAPGKGFSGEKSSRGQSLNEFHNNGAATTGADGTLPESPQDNLGAYTLQAGDTLESVALQLYGDSSLWYLLADANGITDRTAHAGERGSQLHVGQRLNIPQSATGQHHTSQTRKLLTSNEYTGNLITTVASLGATPPAQPPQKHHSNIWKTLSKIVVVVISAVAMVISAGLLAIAAGATVSGLGLGGLIATGLGALGGASTLGLTATLGVSFAAGFIGSIAGQGAASAFSLQKGIDVNSALISGLATAATAGLGKLLGGSSVYRDLHKTLDEAKLNQVFSVTSATEMMERDAVGQSINLAFHGHQHFDWLELGVSTATAGLMGSQPVKEFNDTLNKKIGAPSAFISSEAQSIATGSATTAATGGHFNATQVLTDNLGSAVTSGIMQSATNHATPSPIAQTTKAKSSPAYCPIPTEEAAYTTIPDGTYERFHQESAHHQIATIASDITEAWKHDEAYGYSAPGAENLSGTLGYAGDVIYGDAYVHGEGALVAFSGSGYKKTGQSNFDLLQDHIFDHEGGFSNHPNDKGGATNKGITLATFKRYAEEDLGVSPSLQNLKKLTTSQAAVIYKKRYWDPIKADEINSLSIAYALYDFHVNAPGHAVELMQKSVNFLGGKLTIDNKMGAETIKAINGVNARKLFEFYQQNRINFHINKATDIKQKVFLNGWLNRVNDMKFGD